MAGKARLHQECQSYKVASRQAPQAATANRQGAINVPPARQRTCLPGYAAGSAAL